MPISSRTIITFLSGIDTFKKADVHHQLFEYQKERHKGKKNKKGRGRRKSGPSFSGKDRDKIDEIIGGLINLGFIEHAGRGKLSVIDGLSSRGTVKVNTSGNGIIAGNDGVPVIIRRKNLDTARNNDTIHYRITGYSKNAFTARVLSVDRAHREFFLARFAYSSGGHDFLTVLDIPNEQFLCVPKDKVPPLPEGTSRGNILYLAAPLSEHFKSAPLCEIRASFPADDERYDIERIRAMHKIPGPHGEYSELSRTDLFFSDKETSSRKDYRKDFTVTIDGEYAKDFDDAISLHSEGENYHLTVHIADVSHFVKMEGPLDNEALARGTSFYPGMDVIPMLPEILSNELCSLREGEDRYTLTAEILLSPGGEILEYTFHKGIIVVDHRLTYRGADEILAGGGRDKTAANLKRMKRLAEILQKKRTSRGRLDLSLTDEELIFDGHNIKEIVHASRLISHGIIEEFMLTANEAAARFLKEKNIPSLHRNHEPPDMEKLHSLVQFLNILGQKFNSSLDLNRAFQEVIDEVAGSDLSDVVNMAVLKSLMQADYGPDPAGHFGLAFTDYCHFTSPIRRYPDLVVHRCIKSSIEGKPSPYTTEALEEIGRTSSFQERLAQKAERDMLKLKSCRLLSERTGDTFDAIISGVMPSGFYVRLKEMPLEGMVPMRNLTDDFYMLMEDEYTVIGKRYGTRFRMGDSVKVRLTKVDMYLLRIDFEPA